MGWCEGACAAVAAEEFDGPGFGYGGIGGMN